MTEFSKNELLRLVDKIPETDPTSTAYHVLMQSIECFNSLALTVDEIIALRDEDAHDDLVEQRGLVKQQAKFISDNVVELKAAIDPEKVPVHPIPEVPTPEPAPAPKEVATVSAADARKKLVEARTKGINVRNVLSGFGVENFQQLPADKYTALVDALEAL